MKELFISGFTIEDADGRQKFEVSLLRKWWGWAFHIGYIYIRGLGNFWLFGCNFTHREDAYIGLLGWQLMEDGIGYQWANWSFFWSFKPDTTENQAGDGSE